MSRGVARRRAPGKGVQHVKGCRGAAQPRARRVSLACRRAPRLMPQPGKGVQHVKACSCGGARTPPHAAAW